MANLRRLIFCGLALWLISCAPTSLAANDGASPGFYQAETGKPFQEVIDDLKLAISEKNFRLTGHNQIGKAIRERDGGAFPDYDTLQFCNLEYAKEFLKVDPDAVRYMPCTIAVYVKGGRVIVVTHLLPTDSANPQANQFTAKMNALLKELVGHAVAR